MRLQLTVIDGPALVWNGSPVKAAPEHIAHLLPGTTIVAECVFAGGLSLVPDTALSILPGAESERGPAGLIAAGQFDAALRILERSARTADTLALTASALLERHKDVERRTSEPEVRDRDAGMAALAESLKLGGPSGSVDAPTSAWRCWTSLLREERRPHRFGISVDLYRWLWRALLRSSVEALAPFTPFAPLLEGVPCELWPAPPWMAWGLAPDSVALEPFALALCDRLEGSGVDELIRAIRTGSQPPRGARRGVGAAGLLSGLQVALHSSRPKGPLDLALASTRTLPAAERLTWFTTLNEAAAVGAVGGDLLSQRERPSVPITRVLFRAHEGGEFEVTPSISLLANGRLLAVTRQAATRRRVLVTEGGADEVVAVMPEPHFPLAVVAVREALER